MNHVSLVLKRITNNYMTFPPFSFFTRKIQNTSLFCLVLKNKQNPTTTPLISFFLFNNHIFQTQYCLLNVHQNRAPQEIQGTCKCLLIDAKVNCYQELNQHSLQTQLESKTFQHTCYSKL